MTKDVLVSVKGTQYMDGENDTMEVITPGVFYEKNGKYYILYDETVMETAEAVTHNMVKVGPETVEVFKKGIVESRMKFECGKKHTANYMTPMGLIVLGLTTSFLDVETGENTIHVRINYTLEMNGEYISGCSLELSACSKKEGALRLKQRERNER